MGTYDGYAGPELDELLRPGSNTVAFSYPAPGAQATQVELWCKAQLGGTARIVLRFRPTAGRLTAQMQVNFTGRN